MSSEGAGTPTHGHLDREKARDVLNEGRDLYTNYVEDTDRWLDALEACVLPDPRLTRIEALCDEWAGSTRSRITPDFAAREVRAALRGDE